MSITAIADTRVRMRPSKALLKLIAEHKDTITELPANIAKALKNNGYNVPTKVEILSNETDVKAPKIDMKLLRDLNSNKQKEANDMPTVEKDEEAEKADEKTKSKKRKSTEECLYLNDLRWLNSWLAQLRKEQGINVFLHNLIEKCELQLPENEIVKRNPELEARCQKLREQQQNREYLSMTKNVDSQLKYYPEDTIAYQMKALNSQIIAVLQFVFSVAAGFAFGFLGLELIVGNLEFGLRLLLGIVCALIIAVAEIYFLAKKLNEYDKAVDSLKDQGTPVKTAQKPHAE